jgi:hypothetical protein
MRYVLLIAGMEVACMTFPLSGSLLKVAASAGWSLWWAGLIVPGVILAALAYLLGVPCTVWGAARLLGGGKEGGRAYAIACYLGVFTLLTGIPLFVSLGHALVR